MNLISRIAGVFLFLTASAVASALTVDVTALGAVPDGKTDCTEAIQNAVDQCNAAGGGTVEIPHGKFLIRPIEMKSNVELHLDAGTVLLGSTTLSDYDNAFPYVHGNKNQSSGLIWAKGQDHISVTGLGTIDGQGWHENFQLGNDGEGKPYRPKIIYFAKCTNVTVQDLTLRNSAYWTQHYEECERVFIRGLKVYTHCNYNNDGIDLDVRDGIVSDCIFDSEDDTICFKSDHETPCENIVVTNCVAASNCNAIKMGTASFGGFRNISISNITVKRALEDNIRHWQQTLEHISAPVTVISGVAIEMVDGGIIDGISVSNISMQDVQTPVFIRLGDRRRTYHPEGGVLRNVSISNISATSESLMCSSITATEGFLVENVTVSNIVVSHPGGGTKEMAKAEVPEFPKKYPENRMFGCTLPAQGFYLRNVRGVNLCDLRFTARKADARPVFVLDNVSECAISGCSCSEKVKYVVKK